MGIKKNKNTNTIKSNYTPYKKKLFQSYILWNSIPQKLREMRLDEVEKMGINIKDSLFKELLNINTQKEFSNKYKVSEETLCNWNKREDFQKELDLVINQGVKRFKKDVDFSFTQKTIKYGDKGRVELWKKLFEGWTDKKELNISGELSLLIDELSEEKESLINSD